MQAKSIMIVETSTELRNTLRCAFEHRGYLTWTCPGLEVANSVYEAIHPTVVILDLDFECVDFVQLLDEWRRQSPHTRIVVESADGNAERVRQAMNHGAHAFLAKPYTLEPLFDLLEEEIPPTPSRRTEGKAA